MAKVYIIVHDGTNVLVGIGGRSGKKKKTRGGYHLPGGTINGGETPEKAALRELEEETGITLAASAITGSVNPASTAGVTFVVAKVASVATLVAAFVRPPVTNVYDEPFTSLAALSKVSCWTNANFHPTFYTDWFAHGLYQADLSGLLA